MEKFSTQLDESGHKLEIGLNLAKFDATITAEFKDTVKGAWRDGITSVTIDFSDVEFIDSSGIGALLSVQKMIGVQGEPLELKNAGKNVVDVVELLRLHRVFNVKPAGS